MVVEQVAGGRMWGVHETAFRSYILHGLEGFYGEFGGGGGRFVGGGGGGGGAVVVLVVFSD